ncbi:MAG: response regulator [Candidatus Thermoplasmatota archaeon]|nr:response regulator [Candidatus Thermoplasmatota archaeon]
MSNAMKGRILVVDDEEDIRNLAKITLEGEGYKVSTAADGDEAVAKALAEVPDLVLLDIVLPGKSGFDVCKIIKQDPKTKFVPVILFSALGRDTDKRMGKEAGADGYIVKPFAIDILLAEIEKHIVQLRKSKFSASLGLSHDQTAGRKMLMEFDPAAPYEQAVSDFVTEFAESGDDVVLVTRPSGNIAGMANGKSIQFVQITAQLMLSPILEEHARKNIAIVYDNITDIIISDGIKVAYAFTKSALERLSDKKITALFLINPSAHPENEASTIRSIFASQISYGKGGMAKLKMG